ASHLIVTRNQVVSIENGLDFPGCRWRGKVRANCAGGCLVGRRRTGWARPAPASNLSRRTTDAQVDAGRHGRGGGAGRHWPDQRAVGAEGPSLPPGRRGAGSGGGPTDDRLGGAVVTWAGRIPMGWW